MEHIGQPIRSVVAVSAGDRVVGVHVISQPHILPLIEDGAVPPPVIPKSLQHHIIRTEDAVVVVQVRAEVSSFPRTIPRAAVEARARNGLLKALEEGNIAPTPEDYAEGLKAVTQRLVSQMQGFGVEIT